MAAFSTFVFSGYFPNLSPPIHSRPFPTAQNIYGRFALVLRSVGSISPDSAMLRCHGSFVHLDPFRGCSGKFQVELQADLCPGPPMSWSQRNGSRVCHWWPTNSNGVAIATARRSLLSGFMQPCNTVTSAHNVRSDPLLLELMAWHNQMALRPPRSRYVG